MLKELIEETVKELAKEAGRYDYRYRADSGYKAIMDRVSLFEWKDSIGDRLVSKVAAQLTESSYTNTLSTYCQHCDLYIPVDLPGSLQNDIQEIIRSKYIQNRVIDKSQWSSTITESDSFRERMEKMGNAANVRYRNIHPHGVPPKSDLEPFPTPPSLSVVLSSTFGIKGRPSAVIVGKGVLFGAMITMMVMMIYTLIGLI